MPAKKKVMKKEEAPKKRIKPVVEEVVEETSAEEVQKTEVPVVEETVAEESASEAPTEEVVEVVEEVEETPSEGDQVSIEPDFAASAATTETAETPAPTETTTEAVTEEATTEEVADATSTPAPQPKADPPLAETPSPSNSNRMSIKTIIFITLISALVAAFVSGGVYVYLTGVSNMQIQKEDNPAEETKETSSEATPSPTPQPAAEEEDVDFSEYSVQVLNGSGQIGAAGAGSDLVEAKGFVVDDTGNADNYDYENTVVQVKESVAKAALDAVIKALEEDYEVEEGDKLKDDNEYDIVVIVGTK